MAEKSLTAALAIIKHNGVSIGKMRTVRVQETFQRGEVKGIGRITAQEKPVTGWSGTLNCDFILTDLKESSIPKVLNRQVNTVPQFVNALIVSEIPVQVNLYKKVPDPDDPLSYNEKPFATINDLLLESDSFSINEGQVGGKSQSFSYLSPIIFPK